MSKYTARTPLYTAAREFDGEIKVEMVVTYRVTRYRPATQIEPEEPASVEDISIKLLDLKTKEELSCPDWIVERFSADDSFQSWLMSEAADRDEYACDCKADADREERRLGLS